MKGFTVPVLFFCLSCTTYAAIVFDNFEDHLAMMTKETESEEEGSESFKSAQESDETEIDPPQMKQDGSGDGSFMMVSTPDPRPMSCCDIGRIAGVGGFHCNPEYYKPRMQMRNRNRPHNMKLGFHGGEEKDHKYGFSLMRQFRKCVGGLSSRLETEFHKCCKYAYLDNLKDLDTSEEDTPRRHRSHEEKNTESSSVAARRRYKFKHHGDRH